MQLSEGTEHIVGRLQNTEECFIIRREEEGRVGRVDGIGGTDEQVKGEGG